MSDALWTGQEIAAAVHGTASADFAVNGVAFDSREIGPGDLFIALKGETTDGHRFLAQVAANGAGGTIVSDAADVPPGLAYVLVADTTAALNALGRASRARMQGVVIGVTGSVGKTGTKEALADALARANKGRVHRSVKSYNNHTGVPLSLSRMPRDTKFGVFEMGMSAPGELAALTRLVRPHVALVTAIAPAHSAFFPDESAIADAKGEVFQGLEPNGTAILPFDSPHYERLLAAAKPFAAKIVSFGRNMGADVRARDVVHGEANGTYVNAVLPGAELSYSLSQPGEHWVSNSLAVIAAVQAAGGDLAAAGLALADMPGLPGRGARQMIDIGSGEALLIDESYNANPASMAATLGQLGKEEVSRRLAVLGAMKELGEKSDGFHAALAAHVEAADLAIAILVGPEMTALAKALEGRRDFVHVPDCSAAIVALDRLIAPGDAILVKGSNSIGLSRLVAHLVEHHGQGGNA
ncbi:UDP-N-acetylmuramoyl-tripeptide--D-alanyl-D-alanine ligase [Aquisediminimonas sediminicola]|uniref:UDP-N-acetylmuramoyl-tripeptide--D-alanyl-D- alanine ligase n=1 Tax=Alteraquisediminimonas sediminicola TaxID=2676787 RepID=UPI001C8D1E47|nr:UDP-N-acetylmuramoyl-tripeptide--D-alanyl-D-alanine ligase [Aquisediminimonas sediminicola]